MTASSAQIALGIDIGKLLLKALRLEPNNVASITLHNDIDDAAYVEIKRFITNAEGDVIAAELAKYALLLMEEPITEPLPVDSAGNADITALGDQFHKYQHVGVSS